MKRGEREGAIDGAIQLLSIGQDVTDSDFFSIIGNLCPLLTETAMKQSPYLRKCSQMIKYVNSNAHNRRQYEGVTQSIHTDSFSSLLSFSPPAPSIPLPLPSPLPPLSSSSLDGSHSHRKVSGVIVYLCCGSEEEVDELVQSVTLLDQFFLSRFPYDVIIFHEGFGKTKMEYLQVTSLFLSIYVLIAFATFCRIPPAVFFSNTSLILFQQSRVLHVKIHFENIVWEIPSFVDESALLSIVGPYPIGYRHMCRFFSIAIWEFVLLSIPFLIFALLSFSDFTLFSISLSSLFSAATLLS
jgi:hypothetical protein